MPQTQHRGRLCKIPSCLPLYQSLKDQAFSSSRHWALWLC